MAAAVDDGHGANRQITTVFRKAGGKAHGKQTLSGKHHKGGNAQREARSDDGQLQLHIRCLQAQNGVLAGQKPQDPAGTNRLTHHRSQRGALDTHAQHEDKNRVQNDVDHRTDDRGQHADLGKALCGDEGVHAHDQQHKYAAQNVDPGVIQCVGQGRLAGTKEGQQLRRRGIEAGSQHHGEDQQHRKAVAHDLFRPVLILLAHGNGRAGRATGTGQHSKAVDQHQNRQKQSRAGQGVRTHFGNMADIDPVNNIVEQIDDLRHHRRDRQLRQQFADAVFSHIRFRLFRVILFHESGSFFLFFLL